MPYITNQQITTAMLMVSQDFPSHQLTNHLDAKLVSSTWDRLKHSQWLFKISRQPHIETSSEQGSHLCAEWLANTGSGSFEAVPKTTEWNWNRKWVPDVRNASTCSREVTRQGAEVSPWKLSRDHSDEGDCLKLLLVKWIGPGHWQPGKDMHCVPDLANCITSSTPAPMGMARLPLEKCSYWFSWAIPRKMVLIIVDAHYKWPEVILMHSTIAQQTITALSSLLACYGLPDQLVFNNWLQFTSGEFAHFLKRNGIKQIQSEPYHPSSNGLAEHSSRPSSEPWVQERRTV